MRRYTAAFDSLTIIIVQFMNRYDDVMSLPDSQARRNKLSAIIEDYNAHKNSYKTEQKMVKTRLDEVAREFAPSTSMPVLVDFPGRPNPPPTSIASVTGVDRSSLVDPLATYRAWVDQVVEGLSRGEVERLYPNLHHAIVDAIAECENGESSSLSANQVLVLVADYKNTIPLIQHRLTTQEEARRSVPSRECLGIVHPLSRQDYIYLVRPFVISS